MFVYICVYLFPHACADVHLHLHQMFDPLTASQRARQHGTLRVVLCF